MVGMLEAVAGGVHVRLSVALAGALWVVSGVATAEPAPPRPFPESPMAAACQAEPLRSGKKCGPRSNRPCTIHYFCDCGPGAQPGCIAGEDGAAGTSPNKPRRSFEAARQAFNSMPGGDTVAFCRGGSWPIPDSGRDIIANPNCGLDPTGKVIHASLDEDERTVPSGALAPSTVCTWRDYAPHWGGTAPPRISKGSGRIFAMMEHRHDDGGYRWLNLDLDGLGTGQGALFAYEWVHDVTMCNLHLRNWDAVGILVEGSGHQPEPGNSGLNWNIAVVGNRFSDVRTGVMIGGDSFQIEQNSFERVGGATVFEHAFYIVPVAADPWSPPAGVAGHFVNAHGGRIAGNRLTGTYGGGRCRGAPGKVAGKQVGLVVENNLFLYPSSESDPGGGCWLFGTSPSNDADAGWYRGLIVRRNRFVGGGNTLTRFTSCTDCTFESNVFVSDWAGDLRMLVLDAGRSGSGPHGRSGGCVPDRHGPRACDDVNTGARILNNTFYRSTPGGRNNSAILISDTGAGYVVASNAVWSAADHTACIKVDRPSAFVGGNYCRTAGGVHVSKVFVDAPRDLVPSTGSPLIRGGAPGYHSRSAIGDVIWSPSDPGRTRATPPDAGACSVSGTR
jgi:hypothetical protein